MSERAPRQIKAWTVDRYTGEDVQRVTLPAGTLLRNESALRLRGGLSVFFEASTDGGATWQVYRTERALAGGR